jgi:hypothetical protein
VSGDDERPGWLDREKKSFSELDRLRRERRGGRAGEPGGAGAKLRSAAATKQYLKQVDSLFGGGRKGEREAVAGAVHDARGTPGLAAACRAYLEAAGPPAEPRLLGCFLEAGERDVVLAGLEALRAAREAGALEPTPGLRAQLRMLAQESDDEIAGTAEELLALS